MAGSTSAALSFMTESTQRPKAIVGKWDFHLDAAAGILSRSRHRGTQVDDVILAKFPGQSPASTLADKSWGFAAAIYAIQSVASSTSSPRLYPLSPGYFRNYRSRYCSVNPLDSLQKLPSTAGKNKACRHSISRRTLLEHRGKHTITTE